MFVDFAQEYYTWTGRIHLLIEFQVSFKETAYE